MCDANVAWHRAEVAAFVLACFLLPMPMLHSVMDIRNTSIYVTRYFEERRLRR